jgi:hypothetical protein
MNVCKRLRLSRLARKEVGAGGGSYSLFWNHICSSFTIQFIPQTACRQLQPES